MLLRDHPRMRYRGVLNWPPIWAWTGGLEDMHPCGEVGILREVLPSNILPGCFIHMDYKGSSYVGRLLFDDHAFCSQIVNLLKGCSNRRIAEIGSLDLSDTYTL
jgi:hypothetical protein